MQKSKLFNNRLYRVDEVAEKLRMSKRSVYRLVDDPGNNIVAIKVRSALRIKGESLNQYLEENQVEV